jgi:hypothetical protein
VHQKIPPPAYSPAQAQRSGALVDVDHLLLDQLSLHTKQALTKLDIEGHAPNKADAHLFFNTFQHWLSSLPGKQVLTDVTSQKLPRFNEAEHVTSVAFTLQKKGEDKAATLTFSPLEHPKTYVSTNRHWKLLEEKWNQDLYNAGVTDDPYPNNLNLQV